MPFMDYEFPHSNYYDGDLRELVRLYKEFTEVYNNLQKEIQETIDFVNNFEEHADELIDERIKVVMSIYTQRLIAVEQLVKQLEEEINKDDGLTGQIQEIRDGLNEVRNTVFRLQAEVADKFNDLCELMHAYKHSMDGYVDSKARELEQYIKDTVTRLDRLDVINPFTGAFEDIQKVLDEIVAVVDRSYGLTAAQYDALMLTAHEYDKLRITAYDYTTKGYFELWLKFTQNLMRSPFTGTMTTYDEVIYRLADLHKLGLTAVEYDSRQFTAEEFDAMMLTAFIYDWYGYTAARLITAGLYDELKLTAQQYDDKKVTAEEYDRGMRYLIDYSAGGQSGGAISINLMAQQIANLSNALVDVQKEIADVPRPIQTGNGISYVGLVKPDNTTVRVIAPMMTEDSTVFVMSEKQGYVPTVISRYGTTVEMEWPDTDTDVYFSVLIQNKA